MPRMPTKPQHETQPVPLAETKPDAASDAQPTDAGAGGSGDQPIEPDPAEIVDEHRTERAVEDMADEID